MSHNLLVALAITNKDLYANYRREMSPILAEYGGSFRYDFEVNEVLKAELPGDYTRLFVISFPSKEEKEAFYADERYLQVRERYFAPSVAARNVIAAFDQ